MRNCAGYFEEDKLRVPSHMQNLMAELAALPSTAIQKNRGEGDREFRLRLMENKIQPRTSHLLEFLTQVHVHGSGQFS